MGCPTSEKLRLLTLVPQSWTINKTMVEFQVSHYLVKKFAVLRNLKVYWLIQEESQAMVYLWLM